MSSESMLSSTAKAIGNTLAENFGGAAQKLGTSNFSLDDTPDLSGKVALVTGGSEGIGYGVSYTLLKHNIAKLIILSVSREVVSGAKDAIAKDLGQDVADRTHWIQCDLSDWKRVAAVSGEVKKLTSRLDILVNNAARGIMTHQLTDYGVDRHFAVNHVGHVILTSHLLPLLKKTAEQGHEVRISQQGSNAHTSAASKLEFKSLKEINEDYGAMGQYGNAKLANILYSRYLGRHLSSQYPNIFVNSTHPGFVRTKQSVEDIHEPYPLAGYGMSVGMAAFQKDQFEGALSSVYAATMVKETGKYICPPNIIEEGSEKSQSVELQENLMKLTRDLVRERFEKESVGSGCPLKDY